MVLFRAILGPQWRPQSAHFSRVAPRDVQIYKRLFKCPLQFESDFNGLVCLSADLDKPNLRADAAMANYAQSFMDALPKPGRQSIVQAVRRSVYLMLPMGRASLAQVASGFSMNERTLQRELDRAGVSFSSILNDVRRELAQRYIDNTRYSMGRVAELLGYSNLSSFTRWFTTQFGHAPSRTRVCRGRIPVSARRRCGIGRGSVPPGRHRTPKVLPEPECKRTGAGETQQLGQLRQ